MPKLKLTGRPAGFSFSPPPKKEERERLTVRFELLELKQHSTHGQRARNSSLIVSQTQIVVALFSLVYDRSRYQIRPRPQVPRLDSTRPVPSGNMTSTMETDHAKINKLKQKGQPKASKPASQISNRFFNKEMIFIDKTVLGRTSGRTGGRE